MLPVPRALRARSTDMALCRIWWGNRAAVFRTSSQLMPYRWWATSATSERYMKSPQVRSTKDLTADMKRTALVYDFDGTLAQGNVQEHSFIPEMGVSKQ